MTRTKRCPLCGKICRVAVDGKSGYCETKKKHWKTEMVRLDKLQPGPIQHPTLPDSLLDIIRWTYDVVGHYVQPTLEQWELDFMRDMNVAREVVFWHRTAFAFITYHHRRNLPLRSDEEEGRLVALFCVPDRPEEGAMQVDAAEWEFVRQCWEAADGWEQEVARIKSLAAAPNARWTPPEHLGDWPG
jgi:hypothetical protein